jgi:hypothetical protein
MILKMLLQESQKRIICPPPNAGIAQTIGAPIQHSTLLVGMPPDNNGLSRE